MQNKTVYTCFWLFTFAIIISLVVSQLVQEGVFIDGMLYISVSKNLADGIGTFWNPHFSQTSMSSFHEQPPLYFGLLALFYKVLGTSMYVDRLFCFLCMCVTAFFIHKIWKRIFVSNSDIAKNSWLPVLFWISIPVCFWAYTNQVEETVMSIFTVMSIYFIYCSLFLKEKIFFNLVMAGLFIFLSSLTKGIQGLFPLVSVALYWILFKDISFKKVFFYSLILILIPTIIYSVLILLNDEVYESYKKYFEIRLVGTFNNVGSTTENHFDLLQRLIMELLPIVSLALIFLFLTKKQKQKDIQFNNKTKIVLWFVFIGLSGSLPLMVTLEQRGFYLVTTLPFFAIAISLLIAARISQLLKQVKITSTGFKIFGALATLLFVSSIIFSISQIGNFKRDKNLLTDIYQIGKIIPHGDIIYIPDDMWNDWSLREYFIRNFYISTKKFDDKKLKYFLNRKNLSTDLVPKNYTKFNLITNEIDLYKLNE